MNFAAIWASFIGATGIGVGITLGLFIGLSIRKKRGNAEGLIGGSVVLTSLAAGVAAMAFSALVKTFTG